MNWIPLVSRLAGSTVSLQLPSWTDWLDKGLTVGLVVIALVTGARGIWVFGWVYRESVGRAEAIERDRDFWRDLALRLANTGERAVSRLEKS